MSDPFKAKSKSKKKEKKEDKEEWVDIKGEDVGSYQLSSGGARGASLGVQLSNQTNPSLGGAQKVED